MNISLTLSVLQNNGTVLYAIKACVLLDMDVSVILIG